MKVPASTCIVINEQGASIVLSPVVIVLLQHIVVEVSLDWLGHWACSGGSEDEEEGLHSERCVLLLLWWLTGLW